MKKLIGSVMLALMFLFAAPVAAQESTDTGFKFGIGLAAPVSGRSIITSARNDSAGITRAEEALDSSPQFIVEFHKPFYIAGSKYSVGPGVVFAPSFSTTASSNADKGQPVGGGFGLVFGAPTVQGKSFNLVLAWMIHPPQKFLSDDWRDGFQSPRDADGAAIDPEFPSRSPSRVYLGFSVSDLF